MCFVHSMICRVDFYWRVDQCWIQPQAMWFKLAFLLKFKSFNDKPNFESHNKLHAIHKGQTHLFNKITDTKKMTTKTIVTFVDA
jgi:hypothetical protein